MRKEIMSTTRKSKKQICDKNWYERNKQAILEKRRKFKKLNPDKVKQWDLNYYSKEKNFLRDSWGRAKKRARKYKIKFDITFESFMESWQKHKDLYGLKCRYTGESMTFIRGLGKVTPTNLSIDRLDNLKGYVEGNIIFCTNYFNTKKGPLSIEDCKRILEVYEESHR